MNPSTPPLPNHLIAPAIRSRQDFNGAVLWAAQASIELGARRMLWVDADFADWPLDDASLLDALTAWLRLPQRRLTLLAGRYDLMPRRHARFVAWRRDWTHALDTLGVPPDEEVDLPAVMLDDGRVSLHLLDRVHWRGRCSTERRDAVLLHEQFDALAQRSGPDFPVTIAGL